MQPFKLNNDQGRIMLTGILIACDKWRRNWSNCSPAFLFTLIEFSLVMVFLFILLLKIYCKALYLQHAYIKRRFTRPDLPEPAILSVFHSTYEDLTRAGCRLHAWRIIKRKKRIPDERGFLCLHKNEEAYLTAMVPSSRAPY